MHKSRLSSRLGLLVILSIGFFSGYLTKGLLLDITQPQFNDIASLRELTPSPSQNKTVRTANQAFKNNHLKFATPIDNSAFSLDENVAVTSQVPIKSLPKQMTFDEQLEFRVKVRTNPEARKQVLERYFNEFDPKLVAILGAALAESNDPEVEVAAVHFAVEGSPSQRLAGLNLLSQLQNLNNETRAALSGMLNLETGADEQIIIAALTALTPRGPISQSEQASLINTIKPFSNDPNPRIREQGLRTFAEWAPNDPAVLNAVVQATQDLDSSVRLSAVQMLGQPNFHFSDVRDTILASLQDTNENFDVRITAWRALENFPLDAQAHRVYDNFRESFSAQTDTIP